MADVWEFTDIKTGETTYSDGTRVPHLDVEVVLNSNKVGRLNVHMHRHKGPDKITDASFGFTAVIFGPLP